MLRCCVPSTSSIRLQSRNSKVSALLPPRTIPSPRSPILRLCLQSRTYSQKPTRLPRDEEIPFAEVRYIDASGKFQGTQPLRSVLSSFDRETYHLVCVNPQVSETMAPICKLISKADLVEKEREQYRQKKEKKNTKNPSTVTKVVELSWAIAPNDLGHRLKKIEEFLMKGNRLEVVLGTRKGMAKQKLSTMEELVAEIRKTASDCGKEWKVAEGGIGTKYTMFFEGKKVESVDKEKV